MCDPITIGSMALTAAGSAVNGYEQNKSLGNMISARNAATTAELERQKKYGAESRGIFDTTTTAFSPASQAAGLTTAQGSATDAFTRNVPTNVGTIGTGRAPSVVQSGEGRSIADAFAKAAGRDTALGNLTGYDTQQFDNRININSAGRDVDMIGDFSKTSSGVNAVEQRAAYNNAYKPPSGLGDLLQLGGSMGSFQGGKGAWGNSMFNPKKMPAFNPNQLSSLY